MDFVLISLAFNCLIDNYRSTSGSLNDSVVYDSTSATMQCYPAERTARVKRQKSNDGPVMPALEPCIDVNYLYGVAHMKLSDVMGDYRWYRGVSDSYNGPPADVLADVDEGIDDISA